ncbi:MAG: DUF87 domain-containing protein, partial [Anaerolineales bacterium]|nr:DUF87 domain-containing protein [Anaerolineales bacterium]
MSKRETPPKKRAEAKSRSTASNTRGGTSGSRSRSSNTRKSKPTPTKKASSRLRWPSLPSLNIKRPSFQLNLRRRALVLGLALLVSVFMLVLSQLSANQGWLTGGILNLLSWLFGWLQPLVLGVVGVVALLLVLWGMERPPESLTAVRWVGGLILMAVGLSLASMLALYLNNGLTTYDAIVTMQAGGGFVGSVLAQALTNLAGTWGALFVFTAVGLLAAAMVTGLRLSDFQRVYQQWQANRQQVAPNTAVAIPQQDALPIFAPRRDPAPTAPLREQTAPPQTSADPETDPSDPEAVEPWVEPPRPASHQSNDNSGEEPASRRTSRRKPRSKVASQTKEEVPPPQPLILGRGDTQNLTWQLPNLADMLNLGEEYINNNDLIREQSQIIEETLISFGAPGQVVDVLPGPTLVQYCVEPLYLEQRNGRRTKVKVGKIASLADDLALALAARSVRIQAPVPGKGYVGIEVPNESKALVSLRDVMESSPFAKIGRKSQLAIGLGQDVAGVPIAADLAKMPHMLIAGATGSGKSVCVNTIIACLLLRNTPEDLQMVMVDPKRVELTGYNGIPHLAAPVVVDMERVIGTLQWALREMDNRYRQFSEHGARNLDDYNKKIRRTGEQKLPYIVIIIDELADLMMIAPEDTEKAIARL